MSFDQTDTLNVILGFFEPRGSGGVPDLTSELVDGAYLDSLELAAFLTHLENEFGIEISATEVTPENFGTIEKTIAFLEIKLNDD